MDREERTEHQYAADLRSSIDNSLYIHYAPLERQNCVLTLERVTSICKLGGTLAVPRPDSYNGQLVDYTPQLYTYIYM